MKKSAFLTCGGYILAALIWGYVYNLIFPQPIWFTAIIVPSFIFFGVSIIVGTFTQYFGHKRRIANSIMGTIHAEGELVTSPISGREGVYYDYDVYMEMGATEKAHAYWGAKMTRSYLETLEGAKYYIEGYPDVQSFPEFRIKKDKYDETLKRLGEFVKKSNFKDITRNYATCTNILTILRDVLSEKDGVFEINIKNPIYEIGTQTPYVIKDRIIKDGSKVLVYGKVENNNDHLILTGNNEEGAIKDGSKIMVYGNVINNKRHLAVSGNAGELVIYPESAKNRNVKFPFPTLLFGIIFTLLPLIIGTFFSVSAKCNLEGNSKSTRLLGIEVSCPTKYKETIEKTCIGNACLKSN